MGWTRFRSRNLRSHKNRELVKGQWNLNRAWRRSSAAVDNARASRGRARAGFERAGGKMKRQNPGWAGDASSLTLFHEVIAVKSNTHENGSGNELSRSVHLNTVRGRCVWGVLAPGERKPSPPRDKAERRPDLSKPEGARKEGGIQGGTCRVTALTLYYGTCCPNLCGLCDLKFVRKKTKR